jgi:nucleotide-binding universal stress UspA family protein
MSPASEATLPIARALAARSKLPVTLLSVLDVPFEFSAWISARNQVDVMIEREQERRAHLESIAATFPGAMVDIVIPHGRAAAEIIKFLDGIEDPLVVMSSHGQSGFRSIVVGSVTARVVHGAHCPVLVVRAAEDGAPAETITELKRVVVPLDGSPFAEHALEVAADLLGNAGVEFHLVRVPEVINWGASSYGVPNYEAIELYIDASQKEAETYLETVAERLRQQGLTASWEVRQGLVNEAIDAAVEHVQADMVVMASHGRTGFRRFVLGSTAERVLNEANVPVLMVGPHGVADDGHGER